LTFRVFINTLFEQIMSSQFEIIIKIEDITFNFDLIWDI
jgi:hypothetical protein